MNEGLDKQLAVERAVSVFANLDVDGDGDITEVNHISFYVYACCHNDDEFESKPFQRCKNSKIVGE